MSKRNDARRKSITLSALVLSMCVMKQIYAVDAAKIVWPEQYGRATIKARFDDSFITVGVSSRTAGAIDSITWKGKEFVNRNDHGREFQSASAFGSKGECFNPTEAGSGADDTGETSTSKLLMLEVKGDLLETTSQMAYWLGPGAKSAGCHGTISTVASPLSNDILSKKVSIGSYGIPNVIKYDVNFHVADPRDHAGFEALAGYMPPEFSRFWALDPVKMVISPIPNGTDEQSLPVIFSTEDGQYALGVYSPKVDDHSVVGPKYGAWRFPQSRSPTVKWHCYFMQRTVAEGDHRFTCYIALGSMEEVSLGLHKLYEQLGQLPGSPPLSIAAPTGAGD